MMQHHRFPILFIFLFLTSFLFAQKFMRLEVPGNIKKITYYVGSSILYKLDKVKGNDIWYTDVITDFDLDRQEIIFENGRVPISTILAVRKVGKQPLTKIIGTTLMGFGGSVLFYSIIGRAQPCDNCPQATVFGAATLGTGWLLSKIGSARIFWLGTKRRLRLFDLSVQKKDKDAKV